METSNSNPSVFAGARLCVLGNVNRDVKTGPFSAGAYLFQDGETAIGSVKETLGGGGANSAAIAAGLGAQASFIGQVGEDPLGLRLERTLLQCGVSCQLAKIPRLTTGTTINLVFESGQRHFLSCQPNNTALTLENLELGPLRHADHLLRADIWFSEAMLQEGNARLFQMARDLGVATSIDLNWDPLWGHAPPSQIQRRKEAVRLVLPLVDVAHGNLRELNEFTGENELRTSVARLLDWGVGAVLVHLGARGAGWFSPAESLIEPAAAVQRSVVATGTGDVLSVCVMLLHHRRDLAMTEKLRLANRIVAEFMEGRRELIPELV